MYSNYTVRTGNRVCCVVGASDDVLERFCRIHSDAYGLNRKQNDDAYVLEIFLHKIAYVLENSCIFAIVINVCKYVQKAFN